MVTGALDISTDSGCIMAMDRDMALSCRLGPDFVISLSGKAGHSDLDASLFSDTNLDSGGCSDLELLHGARWQPKPYMSF